MAPPAQTLKAIQRSDPWLSVLMPVYNGAATLRESLESVALQSDGVEVILVDQGSKDGSAGIAQSFLDQLNIQIISHPDSSGWIENTNLAMNKARAPFSTYLHQDDLWHPGRAQLLKTMIKQFPEAAIWVHGGTFIDEKGKSIGLFSPPFGKKARLVGQNEAMSRLLIQDTIALPAAMFRTADIKKLGGLDAALPMTADWNLWLSLIKLGDLGWSPENKVGFRLHAGAQTIAITEKAELYAEQLVIPIDRHLSALPVADRPRIEALARASRSMNIWLAAVFHGHPGKGRQFLTDLKRIGLWNLRKFLRDTQIIQRAWPRIRLLIRKKFAK